MSNFVCVLAVTCQSCKDSIKGCIGGTDCPLNKQQIANAAALVAGASGALMVATQFLSTRLLRVFTRSVLDRISFLFSRANITAPFDPAGKSYSEIYQAVEDSECNASDAGRHLVSLLSKETDPDEKSNIRSVMQLLKSVHGDSSVKELEKSTQGRGVYSYTFMTCLRYATNSSASFDKNGLLAKELIPTSSEQFFEALHVFCTMSSSLGFAHPSLIMSFIQKIVWDPIRTRNYSWMMSFCLFLTYLNELETTDDTSINLGNVYDKHGGLDVFAEISRTLGADLFGSIFRERRGEPGGPRGGKQQKQSDDDQPVKWNKKFSKSASPCMSYNLGNDHKPQHLFPNGTCKYNHVCNHFVSDKGPGGMCLGSHKWSECDNISKCDSKVV